MQAPKSFYNEPVQFKFNGNKYNINVSGQIFNDDEIDWYIRDVDTSHTQLLNDILHWMDDETGEISELIMDKYEETQKEKQL